MNNTDCIALCLPPQCDTTYLYFVYLPYFAQIFARFLPEPNTLDPTWIRMFYGAYQMDHIVYTEDIKVYSRQSIKLS